MFAAAMSLALVAAIGQQTSSTYSLGSHLDRGPFTTKIPPINAKEDTNSVIYNNNNNNNNNNNKADEDESVGLSSDLNLSAIFKNPEALQRRIEMSTEFFIVPKTPTTTTTTKTSSTTNKCTDCGAVPGSSSVNFGILRNEIWVIPLLSCAGLTMLLIIAFEIFVLCKARQTIPSRRHLFLGQMLLLGLFFGATVSAIITMSPTQLTCAVVRFGTGVAYAIIFSSLLVKCIFLISLNSGVYLPASYQGLLLFFAILVQIAIGIQWLFTNPPIVDTVNFDNAVAPQLSVTADDIASSMIVPLCRTTYVSMLWSLIYVIFLILFVTLLAFKSRGICDNYREAQFIGLSVGCSIPMWLVWIASGFVVNERHKDACLAFGLVVTSIVVFLVMFMPKSRQLAAMGKEGLYLEDREERFSSLSRAGSGYSPSFYHFKPTKYGVISHKHPAASLSRGGVFLRPDDGNVYTTLEQTLSTNPNVYFQRGSGVHPGMMY
ncbi:metabotropic glutamate receptor 3 isoform X2 [Agrilus planipennis]|uniref:Metabotropic glutamate receptor 3 isoform X2 n=1 Tax=Agrilus planipennis TaxID=224129 RepID=A0A1W4WZR5_AGRPL|nr:metabotropic glutamate receptor 3 isoform X2 [Agrilus planipennis]